MKRYLQLVRYLCTWLRPVTWLAAALHVRDSVWDGRSDGLDVLFGKYRVASMFASLAFDPIAYCLLTLAGNVLGNYFSLAARLSQWSMFLQVAAAFAMLGSFAAGFLTAALPLPILVPMMLGLALLFRRQAWLRFVAVDWYRLRPASAPLKSKLS